MLILACFLETFELKRRGRIFVIDDHPGLARLFEERSRLGNVSEREIVLAYVKIRLGQRHLARIAGLAVERRKHVLGRDMACQHGKRRSRPIAMGVRGSLGERLGQRLAEPLQRPGQP